MDPELTAAVNRQSEEIQKLVVALRECVRARNGTVTAYTSGVVTVQVGLDTFPAPHLASYGTPVVGDLVRVETVHGSPLITGLITGLPSF